MRAFKKELTMLGVLIALAVATAILNPSFLGVDNLRNNVRHISLISLFACGEAMVIIGGGFDLSVGTTYSFSATLAGSMLQHHSVGLAILTVMGLGAGIGLVNGLLVTDVARGDADARGADDFIAVDRIWMAQGLQKPFGGPEGTQPILVRTPWAVFP